MEPIERPDADDLPHTNWVCKSCGFINSCLDAECQNIDCDSQLLPGEIEAWEAGWRRVADSQGFHWLNKNTGQENFDDTKAPDIERS